MRPTILFLLSYFEVNCQEKLILMNNCYPYKFMISVLRCNMKISQTLPPSSLRRFPRRPPFPSLDSNVFASGQICNFYNKLNDLPTQSFFAFQDFRWPLPTRSDGRQGMAATTYTFYSSSCTLILSISSKFQTILLAPFFPQPPAPWPQQPQFPPWPDSNFLCRLFLFWEFVTGKKTRLLSGCKETQGGQSVHLYAVLLCKWHSELIKYSMSL